MQPKLVYKRGYWQSENWDMDCTKNEAFPAYIINDSIVMIALHPEKAFDLKHNFELINATEAHEIAKKLEIFWF